MGTKGRIFQISKFPDILAKFEKKICQIYIPYKFTQSGCIPPKLRCESLAHKGSQTTCPTPGDYLASWKPKPIGQRNLLASLTVDQDFPGKETHYRHVFFYLNRLVER